MDISLRTALASSSRFVKWNAIGDSYSGPIVRAEVRQSKKYQSDALDTWDDGTPKLQCVIVISTDQREDENDTGERNVVVNLWGGQRNMLSQACRDAGVDEPMPGMLFTATWTDGAGGASDPRRFRYELKGQAAAELKVAEAPPADAAAPATDDSQDPVAMATSLRKAGVEVAVIAKTVGLPEAVVESIPGY